MISAIKELYNIVKSLFDFVIGFVQDLIKVVSLLGDTVVRLPEYFGYFFPPALISLFMTIIALVVVYKVLGREG